MSVASDTQSEHTHRFRRKRPSSRSGCGSESEDLEATDREEMSTSKSAKYAKGRGRPPTTGQYVGLAKAKEALAAAERTRMEIEAEKEVAEIASVMRTRRLQRLIDPTPDTDDSRLAITLHQQVMDSVNIIQNVATKSRNLKGTFQRDLKDAAAAIREAAEELQVRTTSEETARLQRDNARLRAEVAELRKEMTELRASFLQAQRQEPPPSPVTEKLPPADLPRQQPSSSRPEWEDMMRTIMVQVGTMLNARFEGLEDRLLPERRNRPPLAADKVKTAVGAPTTSTSAATKPRSTEPPPVKVSPEPQNGKKRRKRQTKAAAEAAATTAAQALGRSSAPKPQDSWATVAKQKTSPGQAPKQPTKKKKARLRPPTTSAVSITLQPEAKNRGMSYAQVLTEAKNRIDIVGLGITSVRLRQAVTGARLLEVAGPANNVKADALALKLKEVFTEDNVRISRPMKCATIRVTGLDDSTSSEEVRAAVARAGECPVEFLGSGEIRTGPTGLGTVWVRCPLAAAKKVAANDRLIVGWTTAKVSLLEPQALRCFRCLERGHVGAKCTSQIDRSRLCYRCGQDGHRANQCSAALHCVLCASKEKPADHRVGSKACDPPPPKKTRGKKGPKKSPAPVKPPTARQAEPPKPKPSAVAMEVSPTNG